MREAGLWVRRELAYQTWWLRFGFVLKVSRENQENLGASMRRVAWCARLVGWEENGGGTSSDSGRAGAALAGYGSNQKGMVTVRWAETGLPFWRAGS